MPRARSPSRDKAFEIYKEHGGDITNRAIAELLGEDEKVIAVWKSRDKWKVVQQSKESCTTKKPGAPKGNKNALGHGAPKGNLNPIKHGAYQNIYSAFLPESERELLAQMPKGSDLENEIQLLRFKIANLSNRQRTFFYDMLGNRRETLVTEEDRTKGILECTKQLEKLIRTQEQNHLQREKLELEKARGAENAHEGELAEALRGIIDELNH